ncbi:nucleoside hydrolase [Halyomorpha halys]|uniref:nucleoside hydrolase n=1 Tax=Halyomorpha halys TaxID=286706 RepID=UPI0006D4E982|nr:uridine nucleosidase 1-like [Halyomorpha halys]
MSKLVIIDNDCGIDDAWALNFLLNLDDTIKILAITCVDGNTGVDNVIKNNLYFLKTAERAEIPVYRGAASHLLPGNDHSVAPTHTYFHGKNGFGDVSLPDLPDISQEKEENAVAILNELTSKHKGEISIICCGPLTNIALALRTYPHFKENVKDLYIMGGNYTGMGNITMTAEFNFYWDPEAAFIVLSELENKIVLLPWETCLSVKVPFKWREELGNKGGKLMSLLNIIEGPIVARTSNLGYKHWISADQLLAAIFINKDLIKQSKHIHATVELMGLLTRGQVVIDHLNSHKPNIQLITEVDTDLYKDMLLRLKQF